MGLVVAVALTTVGWHLLRLGPGAPLGPLPLAFATFAVLVPIAELRPISWLSRDGGGEVTASWTFSFGLLLLGPPGSALVMAAGSSLLVERMQGKQWLRAAFNASQVALALALGHAVFGLFSDPLVVAHGDRVGVGWLLGAVVSGATITAVNSLLTCTVLALHHRFGVLKTLRQSLDVNLSMDVTLLGLAPIAVVVASESILLLPLLLGVVAVVYHSAALALSNRHDAMHDLLTGLPNRRRFEEQAALAFDPATRAGSRHGVVHLDLDGFKAINDRLGHHYGDLVLKEVALRLSQGKRSQDLVARIGGDEFVLLWPGMADAETGRRRAEELLAQLEEPIAIDGIPLRISASVGVALFPEHGEDLSTLLHHADVAMYDAKTRTAGVKVFAPEPGRHAVGRMSLLEDLGRAIGTDQMHLLYQPKLDLPSGRIVGVEALLRWTHPEHGAIAPSRFVALTEQTDLMRQLTEQVIAMAVRQARQWRQEGLVVPMAVNVSARDVQDLRFAGRLRDLAAEHDVALHTLTVELTEHTAMADLSRTRAVLQQLRDSGVRISLDDFGTGYSSLTNLRLLPIDEVKIDRSYVADMIRSGADSVVVGIIVDLAHRLGMRCVAEGVETPEVLAALRDLGCDTAQGYLIGRPTTGGAILEMARSDQAAATVGR